MLSWGQRTGSPHFFATTTRISDACSIIRAMVYVMCKSCGKEFSAKPSHIANGYAKYCSSKCQHDAARTGVWLKCEGCGKSVYRTPKYVNASKSKKYFCSKSCQTVWRNKEFSGMRHAHWKHGMGSYRNIMKRAGKDVSCELCKSTDERVIVVHHKDQNRMNNALSNLVWLCRNCHYIVHQYPDGRVHGLIV